MGDYFDMVEEGLIDEETGEYIGPDPDDPSCSRRKLGNRPRNWRMDAPVLDKRLASVGFVQKSDWHWQLDLNGETLDYWPSKAKWRFRSNTRVTTTTLLANFILEKLGPAGRDAIHKRKRRA